MNEFIKSAEDLIYPNGISVKYITVTEGEYNSDTGSVVNTEVEVDVIGFPKNIRANAVYMPNLVGKEVTEYLFVAKDLSSKPSNQDKIKKNNVVYTVDSIKEHYAQGEVVIYKVMVVKA